MEQAFAWMLKHPLYTSVLIALAWCASLILAEGIMQYLKRR